MKPSRSILARIALTAFVVLLGSAGAAAETPGDFDPHVALELVYGKLDTKGDVPFWTSPEYPDEPMKVSVLGVLPFRQGGAERIFLLTELVPEIEGGFKCHSCEPGIGAATFTKTAQGWRLDVGTRYVMDLGSYGAAPEPGIVKVGPERSAVVFNWGGVGQGHHVRLSNYLLETETGVNGALQVETHSDNSGACEPEDEAGRPCWTYQSSLDFFPGTNAEYFDLKVTTTGPGESDFQEETVYSVTDGTYRVTHKRTVDYRLVAHPISGVELPRITLAARPEVERAVNHQLNSLAGDMMCLPDTPEESQSYETNVEVGYANNDVLSVAIHASYYCGGAHPVNGANFSKTFDLLTGRSVRFRDLFENYTRDSAKIAEAYVATLSAEELEGCEDVLSAGRDNRDDGVVTEEDIGALEMYGFTYTFSPQGLVVQPLFPNVIAACAHPLTLPFERVRELASKDGILMRAADAAR